MERLRPASLCLALRRFYFCADRRDPVDNVSSGLTHVRGLGLRPGIRFVQIAIMALPAMRKTIRSKGILFRIGIAILDCVLPKALRELRFGVARS
jgi:hypothetical protein